jgi:hypothetical protein
MLGILLVAFVAQQLLKIMLYYVQSFYSLGIVKQLPFYIRIKTLLGTAVPINLIKIIPHRFYQQKCIQF